MNLIDSPGSLDTVEFCTEFSHCELGIIDILAQVLLPSVRTEPRGIRAESSKLHACSAPAYLKLPADTPWSETRRAIWSQICPVQFRVIKESHSLLWLILSCQVML